MPRTRTLIHNSKQVISVWHDIPLYVRDEEGKATGHLNFVCEIPRCSRKKFEIATNEVGNPIKQDEKKGTLREFKKVRPSGLVEDAVRNTPIVQLRTLPFTLVPSIGTMTHRSTGSRRQKILFITRQNHS